MSPIRVVSPGHAFFAVTLIALGIMMLSKHGFLPFWSGVPRTLPARPALVYFTALLSIGCGVGVLVTRTAAAASRVLLAYLVLWMLCFRLPYVVPHLGDSGAWWGVGEIAVMMGGAWVLVAWFSGDRGLRIARTLYGLGLIPFGIAHFTFLQRTVSLIPHGLPSPLAWATGTGIAFIVAGAAIVTRVLDRQAAALSALMMALFTLIVWVPVVVKGPSPDDWNEFVGSWVLVAAAWVVADSYRQVHLPRQGAGRG